MRTERQAYIDRSIIRLLANCRDNPLPETALRDHLQLRVAPPVRTHEIDQSIHYLESERRIVSTQAEADYLWRLTDTGKSWWAEHGH